MPPLHHHLRRSSPLLITTLQAILINVLANIIAQYIEYRKHPSLPASHLSTTHMADMAIPGSASSSSSLMDSWKVWNSGDEAFMVDLRKVMNFVVWTCITVPLNFRWQVWLEGRFPAVAPVGGNGGVIGEKVKDDSKVGHGGVLGSLERGEKGYRDGSESTLVPPTPNTLKQQEETVKQQQKRRKFKNVLIKLLCDQGCAAPINCTMFLIVITLLKGGSWHDAIENLRAKFWTLKFAGWKLWPAVCFFNLMFVPVQRRVIVSTAFGLAWNVFLALFIS